MNTEKKSESPFAALWRFFASVKLTIAVLLLLAATSVIGTLIPQNVEPGVYIQAYVETVLHRASGHQGPRCTDGIRRVYPDDYRLLGGVFHVPPKNCGRRDAWPQQQQY